MKINNFLYLIGGTCLFLQGCETWHVNNKETSNLNAKSTLIHPQTEEEESPVITNELVASTQVKKQNFRAQPRRPILDKTIEENSIDSSQLDNKTYTVQKGDTLYQIARKFHVTVNQLVQTNNLNNSNHLAVGMTLNIPSKNNDSMQTMNIYVVQKGDTLTSVASQFHTTIAELKQNNNLNKDTIYIGQKLFINGSLKNKKIANEANTPSSPIIGEKYVVKAGDVLYNIAKRCGMSVQELMQINNIQDPKALQIGQILYLKQVADTIPEKQIESSLSPSIPETTLNIVHSNPTEEINSGSTSLVEEDNFEDLFEESKDIPVIPMEEIK